MKHKLIIPLGIALSLCIGNITANEESNSDPFTPIPKTKEELQKEKTPCDVLRIKVFLEKDGKEVGSYTAYVSIADDGGESVFCEGAIKVSDNLHWRINISADLEQLSHSRFRVDVDDLNMFKKNSDGETVPIGIFSGRQQSKGIGDYLCGELHGMTLKVAIAKEAEQAAPRNR
jgi:hypothetical protein